MDIFLAIALALVNGILACLGVWVALKPPKPEHHWRWILAFALSGVAGVALTGKIAANGVRDQKEAQIKYDHNQQALQGTIDAMSRQLIDGKVEQARMSGHLEGIQNIMENLSKSGWPGMKEIAQAISHVMAQANQVQEHATDKQLCQNGLVLAVSLRHMVTDERAEFESNSEQERQEMMQAGQDRVKTDEIWKRYRSLSDALNRKYEQKIAEETGQTLYLINTLSVKIGPTAPPVTPELRGMIAMGRLDVMFADAAATQLEILAHQLCQISMQPK